MKTKRMTASELKYQYNALVGGHYFTRNNMKFSGDTMANYYVKTKPVEVLDSSGETRLCWELTRRKAVRGGLCSSKYFDAKTFKIVTLTY